MDVLLGSDRMSGHTIRIFESESSRPSSLKSSVSLWWDRVSDLGGSLRTVCVQRKINSRVPWGGVVKVVKEESTWPRQY